MIKEYKTIREIASPLMVIDRVEGVTYDELAEIELPNGEVRRCKVLEVDGSVTDVGNGWRNETDDDERYHKAQKLAEDAVEGEKRSDGRFIEEIAEDYTQQDGNDDSCQ